MAVEQAAFVSCNSFRLLEVFNRHFKLKKKEACKNEKKVDIGGEEAREGEQVKERER